MNHNRLYASTIVQSKISATWLYLDLQISYFVTVYAETCPKFKLARFLICSDLKG